MWIGSASFTQIKLKLNTTWFNQNEQTDKTSVQTVLWDLASQEIRQSYMMLIKRHHVALTYSLWCQRLWLVQCKLGTDEKKLNINLLAETPSWCEELWQNGIIIYSSHGGSTVENLLFYNYWLYRVNTYKRLYF